MCIYSLYLETHLNFDGLLGYKNRFGCPKANLQGKAGPRLDDAMILVEGELLTKLVKSPQLPSDRKKSGISKS